MPGGTADAAVGMMDGAYFVGRKELLDFFNALLDTEYTKIEQTATGAMACQLTSLIFPGSIPMSKVNWDAKSDYEFVQNYKLLQTAFNKHKVQRYVDVDKLIRAKYQDNLEFCQWLKAFYEQSGATRADDYDPAAARAKGKGGTRFNSTMGRSTTGGSKKTLTSRRVVPAARPRPAAPKPAPASSTTGTRPSRPLRDRQDNQNAATAAEVEALYNKNQELVTRVTELEDSLLALEEERDLAVLEIEKERDFYFTKLRDVEVLLQIHQERSTGMPADVLDEVFKVLYATAEEDVQVTEEGIVHTTPVDAVEDFHDPEGV
uniref:EB1 C-terminal domain-containing protein n=1 Tax=Amphora coffeiformis TaxID=265554 RepID=A0A7S3L5F3_9STRA|mmetsp:Transcript_227/g.418  ORF Transcript_227/g.418 Transcript_227/m.418 type:complete len:318 (+) Transcript_227:101-1054(+)